MMTVKEIRGCAVILILALGVGFGVNSVSPNGIPMFGQWEREAGVVMAGSNREGAVRAEEINNPLKVKRMIDGGGIILVDVRRSDLYDQGHIPGARSFPLYEFDRHLDRFTAEISKQDALLLYCSGVTCRDSHDFGARLIEMGYAHVTVYAGGFTEWEEMGFKVETNES